jgi:peptidyl-dipeptidase A
MALTAGTQVRMIVPAGAIQRARGTTNQILLAIAFIPCLVARLAADDFDALARQLVTEFTRKIEPLEIEVNSREWEANINGTAEAYRLKEQAENRLDTSLADREWFQRIKDCQDAPPNDPLLARQVHLLYLQTLPRQLDEKLLKELSARANGLELRFKTFRARVGNEQLTRSQVGRLLRDSTDSARRRAVWEASKAVGADVAPELLGLVRLRNEAARQLDFSDYYVMQLALNEQTQADVLRLFDQLDELTRERFVAAKRQIDDGLALRLGLAVGELRPWHYQDPFFEDAPTIGAAPIDDVYAHVDVLDLCRRFYTGIGLPIDEVLARSDLYEKAGKNPSASCTDIDRAGDVRVLANVVPNEEWMGTMLHELGHAVYSSQYIPAELPYLLRRRSHILTTEGLAMMFERLAKSADWLEQMGVEVDDPEAFRVAISTARRNTLLVFSRFCQVMVRFECELYRDPDQDLNKLWWDLVEKYQGLTRPDSPNGLQRYDRPDYASKLHIVTVPAYFHNYLLGELFASQLHRAIARDALAGAEPRSACYVNRHEVGRFLRRRLFEPGQRWAWNDLTKFATGEELGVQAFAEDLAK